MQGAPVIIKFSVKAFHLRQISLCFFQYSDMNDEMRTEAMELCVTACEKFSSNNEVCGAYSSSEW